MEPDAHCSEHCFWFHFSFMHERVTRHTLITTRKHQPCLGLRPRSLARVTGQIHRFRPLASDQYMFPMPQ